MSNHHVEAERAQMLEELGELPAAAQPALAHGAAVEVNDLIEIGMPFENRCVATVHDPGNVSIGKLATKCGQDRERMGNVAKCARLDQSNPTRRLPDMNHPASPFAILHA
jgi:hypothetical protein